MIDSKHYPIAPTIFESRESELNSRLPELYPNESERQIAEQILVPQLRSVISEALSNFNSARGELTLTPPSPAELPQLCAGVDRALDANRNLLDSEGLGKPLFSYVRSVRRSVKAEMVEAFKGHCRLVLAAHGVIDRNTLLAKGPGWFRKVDFPPYGKGFAFAGLILGETVKHLFLAHLAHLADILGWPEPSKKEKLQAYRSAFASHGITDRSSLFAKGSDWFKKADFPPYGKGLAFAVLILGEMIRFPSLDHLRRIADTLGWPEPSEQERLKGYRSALASHGVTDRPTLLEKGPNWFIKADFPPYGKGMAFAGLILDETVRPLGLDHLRHIADILGWSEPNKKEKFQAYRSVLATHGVIDRPTLLAKGLAWFKKADFPPYGKGIAFAGLILGERTDNPSVSDLRRIADALSLSSLSDETKVKCHSALIAHGITDRAILIKKGSRWFQKADFSPYGKGAAFAGFVLGETVENVNLTHLRRIADILGWPENPRGFRNALATHGITDRVTLLAKGPMWFAKANFPPYGKGYAFAGLVLSETVYHFSSSHLRRIADILFPKNEE